MSVPSLLLKVSEEAPRPEEGSLRIDVSIVSKAKGPGLALLFANTLPAGLAYEVGTQEAQS